jgi:hypothetical protein
MKCQHYPLLTDYCSKLIGTAANDDVILNMKAREHGWPP